MEYGTSASSSLDLLGSISLGRDSERRVCCPAGIPGPVPSPTSVLLLVPHAMPSTLWMDGYMHSRRYLIGLITSSSSPWLLFLEKSINEASSSYAHLPWSRSCTVKCMRGIGYSYSTLLLVLHMDWSCWRDSECELDPLLEVKALQVVNK